MRSRIEFEQLEDEILAPYAMKSKDSAGRLYEEPPHEGRTCYQRDRDRIVHSTAFRKLEYKTQVFVIFAGDYYRTRLTHTIEVAQVARTIGRILRLNEDLIEAIALAHDLGHPPFGHAGENALKEIMEEADFGTFDHNYHSFMIVTEYEKRYPNFNGLNLTEEVLVGIIKHESKYDHYSQGLCSRYNDIGPTLEAKVVDVADSLAYLSHDIDDGLTSGYITNEDLMDSPLWKKALALVDPSLERENKEMFKYQMVKTLIDIQNKDLWAHSFHLLEKQKFGSSSDVKAYHRGSPGVNLIDFSPLIKEERDDLQKLLEEKLYYHYRVVGMTSQAKRVIQNLFKVYRDNPYQLPYTIYPRDKEHSEKEKFQIICNYIASMTDRTAINEYKKLFDPYQKV